MFKVSVPSVVTRNMTGLGKTSGKPYNMDFQNVYIHLFGRDAKPLPFPEKLEVILDKNDQGAPLVYAPGEYVLHPGSLYIDRTGNLAVAPRLASVAAPR